MKSIKEQLAGLTPEQRVELAARLKRSRAPALETIQKRPSSVGDAPLSCAQERLWLVDQLDPDIVGQNTAGLLTVHGEFDAGRFERAVRAVQLRHEVLRTAIRTGEKGPVQVVLDVPLLESRFVDIADVAGNSCCLYGDDEFVVTGGRLVKLSRDGEKVDDDSLLSILNDLIYKEGVRQFDFDSGCLIRVSIIRVCENKHYILLTIHHVVFDGGSVGILMDEIWSAYLQGASWSKSALPIQYSDYAFWQRGVLQKGGLDRGLSYWENALDGMVQHITIYNGGGDAVGGGSKRVPVDVSQGLFEQVQKYAGRIGVTPFHVFLSAYACVISRFSGERDFAIGIPVSLRNRPELDGMIGCFINMLAIRMDLRDLPSFEEFVVRVRDRVLDAMEYAETPFESVVARVASDRSIDHMPLFQSLFSFEREPEEGRRELSPGLEFEVREFDLGNSVYDLAMELHYGELGVYGWIDYSVAQLDESSVWRFVNSLMTLFDAAIRDPSVSIDTLPLLTEPEREQLINGFNATDAEYPKDALIHELFEQQVEQTPQALAVQYEGEQLTYAQLNAKANQLAHWLLGHGAGRGQCVAIVAPRGIPMLLGQLATLKAGGTYVPIDPTFPQERRLFMLKDCWAKVVLSGDAEAEASDAAQAGQDVQWLDLDHALEAVAGLSADNPVVPKAECAEAAYVMYTSGSTGQPKGVMVPHRAISRLVMANGFAELTADDVIVHCSNTAFDASTLEVWGCIAQWRGGCWWCRTTRCWIRRSLAGSCRKVVRRCCT